MSEPLISIIVTVKDAQMTIGKCIDALFALDYKNYEIIVVDDGSSDETAQILKKYLPRIRLISNKPSRGPSESRNNASLDAKGEYIAFTDSDCIVAKDWLSQLLEGVSSPDKAASCGGIQMLPTDATEFEKKAFLLLKKAGFVSDYMRKGKGVNIIKTSHNPSCNVIYDKEIFLQSGGFLPGLWPGEDVELDYRLRKAGYKLFFNPKAIVYHYRPKGKKQLLRMMYRYGWAQGFLVRNYGIFRRIHIVPFLSILMLAIIFILIIKFFLQFLLVSTVCLFLLWVYFNFNITLLFIFVLGVWYWHLGFYRRLINISPY